jgi:hypothetical protein
VVERRKRAPGGGRKPKGEFKGKSAALSTRITPELRAALEAESIRAGMSLSQLVERLLRDSLDRPRRTEAALGAPHVRALAYCVARIATHIEVGTGKRWHDDQFSNRALKAALEILLHRFSPRDAVVMPDRIAEQMERLADRHWMENPVNFGQQKCSEFIGALEYLELTGDPSQGAYFNSDLDIFLSQETLLKFISINLRRGIGS